MPRHETEGWICKLCDGDAVRSVRRSDGRRMHLCGHCFVEWARHLARFNLSIVDCHVQYTAAPRGVCRQCGCSDLDACPEGCAWTNRERTLCSTCVEKGWTTPLNAYTKPSPPKEVAR